MLQHPYINTLQSTLDKHKKLLECLEKRLILIHNNYSLKDEYEKNEIEITKIKTLGEIESIKKVIYERESYFKKYIIQFSKDAEEVDKNFDKVLSYVKANSNKIKGAPELLSSINWETIKDNLEVKIKVYERLKSLK